MRARQLLFVAGVIACEAFAGAADTQGRIAVPAGAGGGASSSHGPSWSSAMANAPAQRIGIFVYENFEPIDVFGFVEAFSIARYPDQGYSDPPPYPFETFLIGRTKANVKSINGP